MRVFMSIFGMRLALISFPGLHYILLEAMIVAATVLLLSPLLLQLQAPQPRHHPPRQMAFTSSLSPSAQSPQITWNGLLSLLLRQAAVPKLLPLLNLSPQPPLLQTMVTLTNTMVKADTVLFILASYQSEMVESLLVAGGMLAILLCRAY
ncbi:hypothetical protein BDW75DRAFT_204245 [Aspergillus navahoensis]